MSVSKTTKKKDIRIPFGTTRSRDGKYQEITKPKYYSESLNILTLKSYLKDPHVLSCFQSRRSGVTMHEWDIRTEDDNSYVADYVRSVLNRLNLHSIVEGMIEAVAYGYAVHEVIYQKTKSESGFEYLTVVDVAQRPQEWFTFDNIGQILFSKGSEKIAVAGDKVLVTQHGANSANPYGFAVFGTCKLAIEQKLNSIRGLMTFIEKYGMPYLEIKTNIPNPTETQLDSLLAMGESLIDDGVTSHGSEVELNPLKFNDASSVQIFIDAINQANNEISKAILSQTMTTENTSGTGSYAMSKTHNLVRQDLIDNDKKMVEQSMNKLIRLICEKRFGTLESYPYFILYEESFIDKTAAETASILLQNPNLKLTAKFYERFGLGQDEFELIEGAPQSAPTMNESNSVNEFAETNKNIIKIAEQNEKITDLIDLLTTDSKFGANMQFNSMNDLLKSVFDVVNNADSYDDILNNLPAQFKEMNSKKFNEFMTKILMISNIHGRNAINREVQ